MIKFEEEIKRPDNTRIDPFSKRDVDFSKLAEKFARGAQTLKKWREYAGYLGDKLDTANHNLYLETEQSSAYHAEIVELKRENQRLVAENLAVKTLIDNANQQQVLPVVPEDVAKLPPFDDMKEYVLDERLLTIREFLNKLDDKSNSDITEAEAWCMIHEDIAYRAMLDGYAVEKPQLFYLKNKMTNKYLMQHKVDCRFGEDDSKKESTYWQTKFTQQKIDSMQTGSYEQIPVEDGE